MKGGDREIMIQTKRIWKSVAAVAITVMVASLAGMQPKVARADNDTSSVSDFQIQPASDNSSAFQVASVGHTTGMEGWSPLMYNVSYSGSTSADPLRVNLDAKSLRVDSGDGSGGSNSFKKYIGFAALGLLFTVGLHDAFNDTGSGSGQGGHTKPVPEASTLVLGAGLLFVGGLLLRRRTVSTA